VSGTAPAPSKDFFELVVHKDEIIFRKWRIKFSKNGKGMNILFLTIMNLLSRGK